MWMIWRVPVGGIGGVEGRTRASGLVAASGGESLVEAGTLPVLGRRLGRIWPAKRCGRLALDSSTPT